MDITNEMVMDTLNMFAFLAVELSVLFFVISYIVGMLQEYIPPEKIRSILSGRRGKGYVVAGFLGSITPFCSCSTIPFLKGLLRAEAGFGTMMVFLFASPLLNPIIIGLFAVTFGLKVTAFYFTIAMGVAIIAGYSLEKLGFEKYVKKDSYEEPVGCASSCSKSKKPVVNKWKRNFHATWTSFKKVFPYLLAGITIGSIIHGFMPTEFVSSVANDENLLAVPVAAVIGIPLYIRAEAVIPLSAALMAKGMNSGAVMSLIIGSAGASLTEVILLKSIFENKMIIAFLTVVLTMAVTAGYLYSYLF